MPHEVIMPALGMAQDTGLIVAWLKKPGDKVASGEALMEVETDKATMEVEAQHDGYLTNVAASEGDDVPVGQVVALISETAEGAQDTPEADSAAGKEPGPPPADGKQVIMPALGMAQDTGTIVAWLKAPGDQVAASDPLMEVETDKATMEVEAGHDGWIAELIGEAGEAIPVGEVVAVITAEKPDAPRHRAAADAPAPTTPARAEEAPPKAAETPDTATTEARRAPVTAPAAPDGRILASPKAKRLAAEQGLDLARLAAHGHPQPFHVADLEVLRSLPAATDAAPGAGAAALEEATARLPADPFDAFLDWIGAETGQPADRGAALAAFAAAALREGAERGTEALAVSVTAPRAPARGFADPDRAPLAALDPVEADAPPDLTLRDLTRSRITATAGGAGPALTVTRDGGDLVLHLAAPGGHWPEGALVACLDAMAARVEDPLRQLL